MLMGGPDFLPRSLPKWCWLNRVDCIRQIDAKDVACNMYIGISTIVSSMQREDYALNGCQQENK